MGKPAVLPLTSTDGEALAAIAADAVRATLAGARLDGRPPGSVALRALGSSFVTLERSGALRGCVGTLDAGRPLYRDAARNALRAMADPRLEPVTPGEWPELTVKVAVLSPPEPVDAASLEELCGLLRPTIDGLIVGVGQRQATFLPAVWRKLPDPADFVQALLAKGGWPRDRLPDGVRVQRYTADEFRDSRTHPPL